MSNLRIIAAFITLWPLTVFQATSQVTNGNNIALFASYWSVEPGTHSIAELHNNLVNSPLSVKPIVYNQDGSALELEGIALPPFGNVALNISEELSRHGHPDWVMGSIEFQYPSRHAGALIAEILITEPSKSIAYTITSAMSGAKAVQEHSVFWLPSSTASIYVAMQNISNRTITVTPAFQTGQSTNEQNAITLGPKQSTVLDLSNAIRGARGGSQSQIVGGVSLSQNGDPGALNATGWIEDEKTGFSTMMSFSDPAEIKTTRLLGTQAFLGAAMIAKGKPNANIDSRLVLRNVGHSTIHLSKALLYVQGNDDSGTAVVPLPVSTLGPGEIRMVSLDIANIANSVKKVDAVGSIDIEYDGSAGSLIGRVFGISQDHAYGFYTALEANPGWAYSEAFWTRKTGSDSILTIANLGPQADKVALSLTSASGEAVLPTLTLGPGESRSVWASDLAKQAGLPEDVDFGGFRIRGSSYKSMLVVKEHVIDFVIKTSTPFYGGVTYATSYSWLSGTSFNVSVGETANNTTFTTWSDSTITYSDDASPQWSDDPSIASVNYSYPYIQVTGVASGLTTVHTTSSELPINSFGATAQLVAQAQVQVNSKCFALLKYRPVDFAGVTVGNHSFWWIQNSSAANFVTDAGPSGTCPFSCGYLVNFVVPGSTGHYSEDNPSASLAWSTGLSSAVCTGVTNLKTYGDNWPQTTYSYAIGAAPNSNTYAHWAGNAAPFSPPAPPNTPGW